MGAISPSKEPGNSELERFKELARKLVAVPKDEADEQAAKRDAEKVAKREKGQPEG